jgi:hypothetical protein
MYTVFAKSVFFSRFKFKFRPFKRAKRRVQIVVFSKFKDQFSFHFEGSDSEVKTNFIYKQKFYSEYSFNFERKLFEQKNISQVLFL